MRRQFNTWIDKLSFGKILLIWTGIVALFGLMYFFLSNGRSYLFSNPTEGPVRGVFDHIYFSFITATSTGFGDIIPTGFFKIIAIFEVTLGLLLLAFVTSRLVSIKQNAILSEIYEISFNERINRLRSFLLLFRQHMNRMITKVEIRMIGRREINDLYIDMISLENSLKEISNIMSKKEKRQFAKVIDPVNTELIYNSIFHSFRRLYGLIKILNKKKIDWQREITVSLIQRCIQLHQALLKNLEVSKISRKSINDLTNQSEDIISKIIEELEK